MQRQIRLGDVLTPDLLARHQQHIRDFLVLEGVEVADTALADVELGERQIKELLEELAQAG